MVIVQITLERQSEDALSAFEFGNYPCPEIVIALMSGSADSFTAGSGAQHERLQQIHKQQLSRLAWSRANSSSSLCEPSSNETLLRRRWIFSQVFAIAL